MGGISEREYKKKLDKIREKLNERARNIRKDFAKIEKMKVQALKKAEEARRSAEHDIDKMEREITKSKDLALESKERLHSQTAILRNRIGQESTELKMQISKTLIPA